MLLMVALYFKIKAIYLYFGVPGPVALSVVRSPGMRTVGSRPAIYFRGDWS